MDQKEKEKFIMSITERSSSSSSSRRRKSCVYYLSSEDCKEIHISNTGWDFTVDINPPISLSRDKAKFALITFNAQGVRNNQIGKGLYVYSDVVSDNGSYVRGEHKPLLRIAQKANMDFDCNPFYIEASREHIDRIRVYIRTSEGKVPSMKPSFVLCTLRLIYN